MGGRDVTLRARVWVEMPQQVIDLMDEVSPSVRGCGLKYFRGLDDPLKITVTLRARVWVEIEPGIHWEYLRQSPSVRGRRLK